MKKKALSLLLTVCLLLSLLPTTVFATSVTKKTYEVYNSTEISDNAIDLNALLNNSYSGHYHNSTWYGDGGISLSAGVYYLSADLTITGAAHDCGSDPADNKAAGNALKIDAGAEVYIYLNGYTLTVDGADAADGKNGENGENGSGDSNKDNKPVGDFGTGVGYAAILLPETATLTFIGTGTVNATGGQAGDGSNGGKGGNGYAERFITGDNSSGGGGGGGGGAGAGGGAAIGTNGTAAVSNGSAADTPAVAGTLCVYDDGAADGSIKMNLIVGAGNNSVSSGSAGNAGTDNHYSVGFPDVDDFCSAGGGGGGGYGGAGGTGAAYGSGGTGGVSGASGTHGSSSNSEASSANGSAGADGSKGADASGAAVKTIDTWVLKGITAEAVSDTFYTKATASTVVSLLEDESNMMVYGYYNNTSATYDEDFALNGTYENDPNWRCWWLGTNRYVVSATDDGQGNTTGYDVTYITVDHETNDNSTGSTIKTTIPVADKNAKDHTTADVAGGDAIKFNDEKLKTTINNANDIAATFREPYVYKNYVFKTGTSDSSTVYMGHFPSFDDASRTNTVRTYTVFYTPYNGYTDAYDSGQGTNYGAVSAEGKYLLGGINDFKAYSALQDLKFRNAGLYTITEKIVRNDDQYKAETDTHTFYKTYYFVIEQADLKLDQAADTVYENTKVQNHQFTRFVEGENTEQVFGTFTFAAEHGEDWGNNENREVNPSIPMENGIDWEFNVYEDPHYNQDASKEIYGTKNLNNYLCQKDGTSADTQVGHTADVQNTYYQGNNGILSFKADNNGTAVNVIPAPMTITVKYEHDQRAVNTDLGKTPENSGVFETKNFTSETVGGSVNVDKYPGPVYATKTTDNTLSSVYAEDVGISGKIDVNNIGWRVVKNDKIRGSTVGGTKITNAPAQAETNFDSTIYSQSEATAAMIDGDAYKGDYYKITVKAGTEIVKTMTYTDTTAVYNQANNQIANVVSKLTERVYDELPACEYYNIEAYEVTVDYIGLYYTTETSSTGRLLEWSGEEEFQWVISGVRFWLDVEQREVTLKDTADFDKIYDSQTALVKQTVDGSGDVTDASKYIIGLADANTNTQFAKKPGTSLYNYLDPHDTADCTMHLELAGDYASKDKGANKSISVTAARFLTTSDTVPSAGDKVAALNYKIVDGNGDSTGLATVTGKVDVAQMYFTHDLFATGVVHDTTPMHELFGIHAQANLLTTVSMDTNGFYTTLTVTPKQELVEKDDAKTSSANFTSNTTPYDYDVQYVLNTSTKYEPKRTDKNFAVNQYTGKVTTVAQTTMGGTNAQNFPAMDVSVSDFGNFKLVQQTETTEAALYNTGTMKPDKSQNSLTNSNEAWMHTILFRIVGNNNNYDLLLPVNQPNNRPVESAFTNRTGGTVTNGTESYKFVAVYPNNDSVQFQFTIPQDSYLEDVKIVALPTYKTFSNATTPVSTFATLLADTTNVIGTFKTQATATGMNKIANPLFLTLDKVNDTAVASAVYFGGSKADTATGYSETTLADANEQIGGSTFTFTLTTGACDLGQNYAIAVVPVITAYGDLLGDDNGYTSNLSVEQKVTDASTSTLTYTGASDDYVYVNYKTLWDTTAGVSGQHGTVNMSYTDNGTTVSLTEQILAANLKDQFNSFGINTEDYTSFFDPAKLIPGTAVSVTLKVWRNGVTENLQNGTSDDDAMDSVTFTWTVSPEDYYRLFKDDVAIFRSSNEKEADTAIATTQKLDNILGYGMAAGNAFNSIATYVTNHKDSMTVADAAWSTQSNFNILTTYADTWYKVDNSTGTRMTINASNTTMSGLALGDNLYPTYEYAKLQRVTTTNGTPADAIDLGYARVIFGQITLDNAFIYATENAAKVVAPFSTTAYTGATKTAYADTADLYWFDGWYKNSDVVSATVNGTITDDGSTPTYTIKEHVNYVTFKDGATTIGYGILDTSKDTKVTTLNFAAVPFTVTQPTIGTANSTTSKNMTFEGTNHYTKTNYTLNGWYTDSAKTEANKVADVTSVAVSPADTFYLKSTYNGGGGSIGGGGAPAPTKFTVPVTGDKDTVAVEATINGKDATIDNVTDKEIETVGTGANVIVDLSGVNKTITSVTIPKTTFESIADSDADGLEVDFPDGTVAAFNTTTVAAIASQATSANIQLVVEQRTNAEKTLTTAQKATVKELQNALVIDAYLVSNGKRISDFKGGEADLTVSYPTTKPVRVWYVAEDGSKTLVPSTFDGKCVTFVVKHFSHYVIEVLDDAQGGYANCPQDETCVYAKFTDADTEAWYHDGVHFCVENGYMQGVSATAFNPSGTTTRAMIVTMLWRMEGEPVVNYAMSFKDVKGGQWYTEAIRWAQSTGVVEGYSAEKFGPNDPITREQMAVILYRYAKYHEIDVANTNTLAGFTDTDKVSAWALDAMKWANAIGLVQGRTTTTLVPEMNITRAEAATMVQRYCETFKK